MNNQGYQVDVKLKDWSIVPQQKANILSFLKPTELYQLMFSVFYDIIQMGACPIALCEVCHPTG